MHAKLLNDIQSKWDSYFEQLPKPYTPLSSNSFDVRWNSKMRSRAGVCYPYKNLIVLNPHLLKTADILEEVYIHELCHLVVSKRWPLALAHGAKWQGLMRLCGFEPKRCHELVVEKKHKQRRWPVTCNCKTHLITTVLYNRLTRGTHYKCLSCKGLLKHEQTKSTQAS
ncbi:MAG: SprT-like domain-containing protein [Oligoflexia bacterium]|nr:SprT-like domain-containing protein [Oligoflexia bacterium]